MSGDKLYATDSGHHGSRFQACASLGSPKPHLGLQIPDEDGHLLQLAAILLAQLQPQLLQPLLAAWPQDDQSQSEQQADQPVYIGSCCSSAPRPTCAPQSPT